MHVNKIRLLHLVKTMDLGGIEKSTILYSNHLSAKIDFVGIYASKGFYDEPEIIEKNVKRFFPPYPVWKKLFFFKNLVHLLAVVKQNAITHIHYHHRIYIPFVYVIKKIRNDICIIYSHQNVFEDVINHLIVADKIIALTKAVKNDLPSYQQNKASVIPHGILPQSEIVKKNNPSNFAFVGRFVEWKGVLGLIDEFKIVNDKYPNTKLFFVGAGPLKQVLVEKANSLFLHENIIFIEPQTNLDSIYNKIDILVLPSKSLEGFGIVLPEAMSFGIPAVVYDIPTFNETIIDNFNGIVAKGSISDAMITTINSDVLYSKLSNNAYDCSKQYFVDKIMSRYINEVYL